RHLSFFEMLGNFSFGGYFKKEMCEWALEFCLEELELPIEKLYFSVFEDDDECIEIWYNLGISEDKICLLGEDDNFWRAGPTGPCGPCSEIYFDKGEDCGCGSFDCAPGCDCDRYVEFWNLVFTQFDGQEDGKLKPLQKKNIDTGMGLERMAAIMQGMSSNYETDILRSLVAVGERLSGKKLGESEKADRSLRIMADHSRSAAFMIADGIMPSNEGRGYVLRRLIRRSATQAFLVGISDHFLNDFVDELVCIMGEQYHELIENRELIRQVILNEEKRFGKNLEAVRSQFGKIIMNLPADQRIVPGETSFMFHDTYGFPIEWTIDFAEQHGLRVDVDGFQKCLQMQQERGRSNSKDTEKAWELAGGAYAEILKENGPTEFIGYEHLNAKCKVISLLSEEGERIKTLTSGNTGFVVMDRTPFYGEKGGQVGDTGRLGSDILNAEVLDTQIPIDGISSHKVKVFDGAITQDSIIHCSVSQMRRFNICCNHTATHLLHYVLRDILGEHVKQAGSYVGPDRLRFDFTHFAALSDNEICKVDEKINWLIAESHEVQTYIKSLDEARREGVIALFGEKYGDEVRVIDIEGVSKELCVGTHVKNTAGINIFKIVSESSVGSNIRRIEALTSLEAFGFLESAYTNLVEISRKTNSGIFEASERVSNLIEENKDLKKKLKVAKKSFDSAGIASQVDKMLGSAIETDSGYKLLVGHIGKGGVGDLRNAWDILRRKAGENCACVLSSDNEGKPLLIAAGTDSAVDAEFNASRIIKQISPIIKGCGGGKLNMAQAGGSDMSSLDLALEKAKEILA
ncbi:MAG: alanine--tRNA ligase, partial [Eggerthellaceae bacterium]|nr:alanine--tRNA ligase [Eggerthellaceae bacterium]